MALQSNWRAIATYDGLALCGRPVFAWEWLRRSSRYREAWAARTIGPVAYGLHHLEDPDSDWRAARLIWHARVDPHVLRTRAVPATDRRDVFDIGRVQCAACHDDDADGEHWLFSDCRRSIRVDVEGTLQCGPVHLVHRIEGIEQAKPSLVTLSRLIALARHSHFESRHFPRETRAVRWVLALRMHDAMASGAPQREIAASLFNIVAGINWKVEHAAYWERFRRLARLARQYANTDTADWLNGIVR